LLIAYVDILNQPNTFYNGQVGIYRGGTGGAPATIYTAGTFIPNYVSYGDLNVSVEGKYSNISLQIIDLNPDQNQSNTYYLISISRSGTVSSSQNFFNPTIGAIAF